jgi:hypothetical protein
MSLKKYLQVQSDAYMSDGCHISVRKLNNFTAIRTAFPHISVSLSSIFRRGPAGDGVRVSR